jgi:pantothenate kinase/AraC-like DNA-binding protein/PAS domain-containing protein
MAKITIKSRFRPQIFSDPNSVSLLVNKYGRIVRASDSAEHYLRLSSRRLLGRNIREVMIPLSDLEVKYLDIDFIKLHKTCPQNLFVRIEHPDVWEEVGVFGYSYSEWQNIHSREYLLVMLYPQSNHSPVLQKFLTLYRSQNQPIIMLDRRFRITSYNYHFLELINFYDERKILNASIFDFLHEKHREHNPFVLRDRVNYVKKVGNSPARAWKKSKDLFARRSSPIALMREFKTCAASKLKQTEREVHFTCTGRTGQPYFMISRPVNFPEQDLRIEFTCMLEEDESATLALSHGYSGPRPNVFDPAYHIDVQLTGGRILNYFFRRSAHLATGSAIKHTGGRDLDVTISRIGGTFSVHLNNVKTIEYNDPQPLFGRYSSHFWIYAWDSRFVLKKFRLFTRSTIFNPEKLEEAEPREICFKASPDALYRFNTEPVSFMKSYALAVRFNPRPVSYADVKVDRSVSLFEEARDHIDQNYFRRIDFKSLARQCFVTYKYFIKRFKQLYGFTPKLFQTQLRLKEAKMLLESGRYKVKEVGEMVGFENEMNFQILFKKHAGSSPGRWPQQKQSRRTGDKDTIAGLFPNSILDVCGLPIKIDLNQEILNKKYLPLVHTLYKQYEKAGEERQIFALAGAPGSGKSVFAGILEKIFNHLYRVRLINTGIDAFHHYNYYLFSKTARGADKTGTLKDFKGRYDTYDTGLLFQKIQEFTDLPRVELPVYSRKTHDPIPNQIVVSEKGAILLVEGQWVLSDYPGWGRIRDRFHYKMYMESDERVNRERVVQRFIMGGRTQEDAEQQYDRNDHANYQKVEESKKYADLVI